MWLVTNFGFFSIVEKQEDKKAGTLTVRARVKSDLVALRERYLPSLGEITGGGTDYKCRAKASRDAVAMAISKAVIDLNYNNFKSSVGKAQGAKRESLYHEVWDVLYKLQTDSFESQAPATGPAPFNAQTPVKPRTSYGGVLFNPNGQVLLVEPTNHYDGTVWTWPKGKAEDEEMTAEAVALREVLEETGYQAQIVAPIPGRWSGTTGHTEYFIMRPAGPQGPLCKEIAATKWVDAADAPQLIQQTEKATARQRDLQVLAAAIKIYDGMRRDVGNAQ